MAENENENVDIDEDLEDGIEGIIEDVVEETLDESDGNDADIDVDVEVNEAPEIPESSYVDVGDLHISGPPEMVERITKTYLKDHIDHNPHPKKGELPGTVHIEESELGGTIMELTPDPIEDVIEDKAETEIFDAPPEPSDWLFRPRFNR